MRWWSKKRVPLQPVYSELGETLFRLLEEKEGEWNYTDEPWNNYRHLFHPNSEFRLRLWHSAFKVTVGDHNVTARFTPDDLTRLKDRCLTLIQARVESHEQAVVLAALRKITPNPFDATARELARQVLKGDASAARPLVDRCIEILSE